MRSSTFSSRRLATAALVLGLTILASEGPYHARYGFAPEPDRFFHPSVNSARILEDARGPLVVFVGDSHVMADVDPDAIERRLAWVYEPDSAACVNLLVGGRHPALGLSWLDMAGVRAALVVLDVSSMRFAEPDSDEGLTELFRFHLSGRFEPSSVPRIAEYEAGTALERMFPSSQRIVSPRRVLAAAGDLLAGRRDEFVYDFYGLPVAEEYRERNGFSNIERVELPPGRGETMEDRVVRAAGEIIEAHGSRFEYLERFLAGLAGVDRTETVVVAIRAPMAPELYNLDSGLNADFHERLRNELAELGVPLLEYPGLCNDLETIDGHHLAGDAARRYSEILGLDLAQIAGRFRARRMNELGRSRREAGDLPGAVLAFSEAIRLAPKDPAPRANRGLARAAAGDFDGAVEDLEAALAIAPPDWPLRGAAEEALRRAREESSE